jgi:hypothetical protein
MPSDYDATEFVDNDFQATHKTPYPGSVSAASAGNRAPSREEVDSKVGETQQKLAELKRVQEELERERAGLEETRRRQIEFQTGREESIQSLTRGIGLLTEGEFAARRDAEAMAKTLADMQLSLDKLLATSDQGWTKENFSMELTRALTVIENARMEWNTAQVKFPILSGQLPAEKNVGTDESPLTGLGGQSFGQLAKVGLALTWPLAAVALLLGLIMLLFLRR